MKKLLLGIVVVVSLMIAPLHAVAQIGINVNISLPPPIAFAASPEVIVVPDTDDVYVVPDIDIDLFFWNGWWWRLWDGRWYRSRDYDRSWAYYRHIPRFYYDVDPSWRVYYRDGHWRGFQWAYERIPNQRLRQNWNSWRTSGYWQRQRTWGVRAYRPLPSQQRQDLRNWRQEQERGQGRQRQRPPQVQEPRQQPRQQPQVQEPRQQPRQQPQVREPRQQPRQQPQVREPRQQIDQPQRQEQRIRGQQPQRSQPQERQQGGEGERRR